MHGSLDFAPLMSHMACGVNSLGDRKTMLFLAPNKTCQKEFYNIVNVTHPKDMDQILTCPYFQCSGDIVSSQKGGQPCGMTCCL